MKGNIDSCLYLLNSNQFSIQEKKAEEVSVDNVDSGKKKKQRSKSGFKGEEPVETYEAG